MHIETELRRMRIKCEIVECALMSIDAHSESSVKRHYDTYQQARLRVTGTSKVDRHWQHLSPTTSDVKSMAIHSFV